MKHIPKKQLTAYLDGQLPDSTTQEVSLHLESCAECRELLKNWEGVNQFVGRASDPEYSEQFDRLVMERIQGLEQKKSESLINWDKFFVPNFAFEGLAVVLAVALLLFVPAKSLQTEDIESSMESVFEVSFAGEMSAVVFPSDYLEINQMQDGISEDV